MGLHFSEEEFKSRKSKVLNSMKEQNIDALLMFRQESMYWLTGYDTFGYVFFQTLILDKNGNIILLTRALVRSIMFPFLSRINVWKKTYPKVSYPVNQYIDSCLNIKRASIFCSFIEFKTFDFLDLNSSSEK